MISIIIPTLNEEKILSQNLAYTLNLPGFFEVIIADGGSHDKTTQIAQQFTTITVVASPKGRARQMNTGASYAQGEWLLFLHADTRLPISALTQIHNLGKSYRIQAGGFLQQFSGNDWRLKFISYLDNRRCRKSRIIFGDQALFIKKELFEKLGGFPDQEILEDIAFSQLLIKETTPILIEQAVITDSRRFEKAGILRSFLRVAIILTRARLGMPVSPQHPFFTHAR